jgi:spore photoproduct lyase
MQPFQPQLVYVEPRALKYPLGKELYNKFKSMGIEIRETTSHNQIRDLPGEHDLERYRMAKSTLVIGVRKTLKFDSSKPSAEYALPLATGCMGHCHYCYLQTTLGSKPYIRVYVNVDEILAQAKNYIDQRAPEITRFEASCTSDIVGIDHLTGTLKQAIEFFGRTDLGRLRFTTKYHFVDHLLGAKHQGNTRFRFSLNSDWVVKYLEPKTSPIHKRIEAAGKVAQAEYPLGIVLAPLYRHPDWKQGYLNVIKALAHHLPSQAKSTLSFELIQHRFTKTAKKYILQRYPKTKLEMDEQKRAYKWGRYGRGKYVYPKEEAEELKNTITRYIHEYFPEATIEYFT